MQQNEDKRNKGARRDEGKIIKGTITEAPTKIKISSIPSKIQNIVYNNHHKPAFGNSQIRFYSNLSQKQQDKITPGPGTYSLKNSPSKIQSKKGHGVFINQKQINRFNQKKNWNPGPGQYNIPISRNKSASLVNLSSSLQRSIFDKQLKQSKNIPGPGIYNPIIKRSVSTAKTVFKSTNSRFYQIKNENPPVGGYYWQQIRNKTKSFKFSNQLKSKFSAKNEHSKYINKLIGAKINSQNDIGPGKYNPNLQQNSRKIIIKDDGKDRFGRKTLKIKQNQQVNFLDANKQQYLQQTKTQANSSAFKSNTKRYDFSNQCSKYGDPAKYSPQKHFKKSHLINFFNKWV